MKVLFVLTRQGGRKTPESAEYSLTGNHFATSER